MNEFDLENGMEIDGLDSYSGKNVSVDDIEEENVTLMMIGIDCSGSMWLYEGTMRQCLSDFRDALVDSKEASEILISRANFSDKCDPATDISGYKHIEELDTSFSVCRSTAMYDCIVNGSSEMMAYRDYLRKEGVRVKAVFAIFSDGYDNVSRNSKANARQCIERLNKEEITTAFISFGGDAQREAKECGFKNILTTQNSASELRKAFDCLSKSVIESSKSVVADDDDFFVS